VRAHNAKYQARMRKRKPKTTAPAPEMLPELGPEYDGGLEQ